MTNKEKSKQIAEKSQILSDFPHDYHSVEYGAIEMAEWKDQTMINKACEYIYSHAHVTTFGDIRLEKCSITEFIDGFRKAMEE